MDPTFPSSPLPSSPPHSGIFIVVRGTLGVFLDDGSDVPILANTLRYGESVGDLDVVDGARRTATCIALEEGCLLVQVRGGGRARGPTLCSSGQVLRRTHPPPS